MPNPDAAQSDRQLIIAWPGHQLTAPLTAPVLRLGRHPDGNDIVIEAPAGVTIRCLQRGDLEDA